MILLLAVLAGLLAGLIWANWRKQAYTAPDLRATWLVVIAFLPQLFIAYLPITHRFLNDKFASAGLLASLILFLTFAWLNRHLPGMPVLIGGLLLNFLVMVANGGWMPISPQTANILTGKNVLQFMTVGSRFGEKDILLPAQQITFEFLSDRFLFPAWFPYKTAFSLGDILIGAGVFWLLAKPAVKLISLDSLHKEGVVV